MRKVLILMALCVAMMCARAEVKDAFKGFLPVTDRSMQRSLNGVWRLKVVKGVDDDKKVPAIDSTWGNIPVPGCWEAYGFCEPKYDYPDSLTGYYRTEFTVPDEWRGQQVVLRLDGVLRAYDLWLNDKYVGAWESAYNTCLFDLTPFLNCAGSQQLAMRVYTRFKGYEFDCFDDWAANGIFRDVTLMAVPRTHLSDLTISTKNTGEVSIGVKIANAKKDTRVKHEILDAQGRVAGEDKVESPHLWTAETPYLYTLRTTLSQRGKPLQTFEHRFGFREISIDGNVLKLNGQPIKLRGVNAHATDPWTVKVVFDDLTLKDLHMMKEASVNFIRLSHYPREPRFYELADSLGFYLVDEVPFGYGDKHLGDRSYQDILLTRAQATVARDKSHPSVLVWSVGNENPLPQTCIEVGDYVGQLDPSRPYCFPQVGSYFRRFFEGKEAKGFPSQAPIYAPHYPTTGQMDGFYQHRDRPVIFTEYCHTLGISFEDHDRQWEIIERTPGIAGGGVWEWADQGMRLAPAPSPKGGESSHATAREDTVGLSVTLAEDKAYGYEERVFTTAGNGFAMYGNKGTDGLVYADRTPLPNYYELQHNYARAFVSSVSCDPAGPVSSATAGPVSTSSAGPVSSATAGPVSTSSAGPVSTSSAGPVSSAPACPVCCDCVAALLTLTNRYDFLNLKDNVTFHWALTCNRDTVLRGAFSPDCQPHSSVPYRLSLPQKGGLTLLHFDIVDAQGHLFLRQSFVLHKPQTAWTGHGSGAVMAQQKFIRTGRKPTMGERLTQKGRLPQKYLLPLDNSQVRADIQSRPIDGGEEVTFTLTPDTADVFRSELGLAYLLDPSIDRVQWIGYGPFASYPARHQANRYGLWAKHKDDLYFEGNHSGIDAALLTDSEGNGILITGDSLSLNFEQTDRGIVLTVNAAVSGQGPKFAKTHFPGWQKGDKPVTATFCSYYIKADAAPDVVRRMFAPAAEVPAPFHPFKTQYDTYLLKLSDIAGQ